MADPTQPPYQEGSDPVWAQAAASSFRAEFDDGTSTMVLSGSCPRCGHGMEAIESSLVVQGVAAQPKMATPVVVSMLGPQQPDVPTSRDVTMWCSCATAHPGATAGQHGCGAFWNLDLEWVGTTVKISPGPPATYAQAAEAQQVAALQAAELERVRAAAVNWRTGLAGLVALITTATVVKGRDTIVGLPLAIQVAVALLMLAALGCAVYGGYRAMRAAFGMPTVRYATGKPGEVERWQFQSSVDATKDLWWAIRLTVATIALLVLAIGVTWFASPSATLAQAETNTASKPVCGELRLLDEGKVVLRVAGTDMTIKIADLKSLKIVDKC